MERARLKLVGHGRSHVFRLLKFISWAQWYTRVILVLGRLRQEDHQMWWQPRLHRETLSQSHQPHHMTQSFIFTETQSHVEEMRWGGDGHLFPSWKDTQNHFCQQNVEFGLWVTSVLSFAVLGSKPRTAHILGKYWTTKLHARLSPELYFNRLHTENYEHSI